MKNAPRGFTTIELVMTLAIASIMMGLAVYNFIDQMPRRQLKEASQTLVGDFLLARQKAITEGKKVIISFPSTSNPDDDDDDDDDGSSSNANSNSNKYVSPVLGERTLPQTVRFGTLGKVGRGCTKGLKTPSNGFSTFDTGKTGTTTVTFQPNGIITDGAVYLKNSNESVAIVVNITGSIRQCWWDGNGWK